MSEQLQKRIDKALEFFKNTNLEKLELGQHIINEWLYVNVQEYETKELSQCRFESHRKYVDVQYMINGIEAIETADIDKLEIDTDYSDDKDVMFWKSKSGQMRSVITKGSYVILYPQNAHMPCIAVNSPMKVKKAVAKVLIG